MGIGTVWKVILLQPLMNTMLVLSHVLFDNFGLAIIAITIITKFALYPLNLKQMRSTRAMQDLQPKLQELRRKFGKDPRRINKETMALYRQAGMNPVGCVVPMLVQLPIWIGIYQSITRVLAVFPEDFLSLSQYLYSWSIVHLNIPLERSFLWLDLAVPDGLFIMPILTGGTMWVQQKMITINSDDPQQRQSNTTMLWMMPIMFALLTFQFPSGLALYWTVSNILGIVTQYFVTGWGGMADLFKKRERPLNKMVLPPPRKEEESLPPPVAAETKEEGESDEQSGDKGQERGGSRPPRAQSTWQKQRRSQGNRPKRR